MPYQSLNLMTRSEPSLFGTKQERLWETITPSHGEHLTLNTGGVPQRRKRIYLVADFTGRRAGEILFKPESLRGAYVRGNEAGEGATADAVGGVDGSVGVECLGFDMYNQSSTGDKTRTLKTPAGGDDLPVVCLQANGIDRAIPYQR